VGNGDNQNWAEALHKLYLLVAVRDYQFGRGRAWLVFPLPESHLFYLHPVHTFTAKSWVMEHPLMVEPPAHSKAHTSVTILPMKGEELCRFWEIEGL